MGKKPINQFTNEECFSMLMGFASGVVQHDHQYRAGGLIVLAAVQVFIHNDWIMAHQAMTDARAEMTHRPNIERAAQIIAMMYQRQGPIA